MNSPDQNLTKLQIYVIEELKEYIDKDHLKDKLTAEGVCRAYHWHTGRKGTGGMVEDPLHAEPGPHLSPATPDTFWTLTIIYHAFLI